MQPEISRKMELLQDRLNAAQNWAQDLIQDQVHMQLKNQRKIKSAYSPKLGARPSARLSANATQKWAQDLAQDQA